MKAVGKSLLVGTLLIFSSQVWAHGASYSLSDIRIKNRKIQFPNVEPYLTLVADLHTHSVFSDGHVWPNIRVQEAIRDGLDLLSLTEHIEYQPHIADLPHKDRNRAYLEAKEAAKDLDILIANGAEITRSMPVGHINAIFIEDANKLSNHRARKSTTDIMKNYKDAKKWPAEKAVAAANKQGAFLFWNHPMWPRQSPDGISRLTDFHKKMLKKKFLHGIEVANGTWFSESAFQIALDHELTLIGTSDVHNLIDWDYVPHEGGHRPVTLVFARKRTLQDMQDALFQRRTVVWFKNQLIGRARELLPLLKASLKIKSAKYDKDTQILALEITNTSDARFISKNLSDYTLTGYGDIFEILPQTTTTIRIRTRKILKNFDFKIEVLNALIAPKKYANLTLSTEIEPPSPPSE